MPFQRRLKLHIPLASYGKILRRRAWLTIWDRAKIPRYSHKLMYRKRVTCEQHDSYFRSIMIKTCHSKDGGSCIFRWPVMGRDWVDVELLYNAVHRKFNQFGEQMSWREDAGLRNMSQRKWSPRPSVEQPRRTGKKRVYGQ